MGTVISMLASHGVAVSVAGHAGPTGGGVGLGGGNGTFFTSSKP
jgi:hypothetical protein